MRTHVHVILLAAAIGLNGCASTTKVARTSTGADKPPVAPLGATAVELYPTRSAEPAAINPKFAVPAQPAPVWHDAEVEEVFFDAYINEKGEAFRPGSKFVIRRPGGWNIDSIRNAGGAYIPAENVGQVAGDPSAVYTPVVSPGTGIKSAEEVVPAAELVDASQMRVTGLFGKNREALAKSQCGPGEVAVEHPQLGWVIVPATAVHDNLSLPLRAQDSPK